VTKASSSAQQAARTPRLVAGRDIRSLPLSPREAFLLSRIDGSLNESDLATLTGFDPQGVSASIDRLIALGAVELDPRDQAAARGSGPVLNEKGTPPRSPAQTSRPSQTQFRTIRYDARELDEPSDLDLERKRRVLEVHAQLGQVDYYTLLGIAEGCEKKDIKRAYYAIGPDFHPDRFYGKNLGSFKAKMEAIFGQLTFAYETLASPERRAEYDAYLATQKQTRSMEELLSAAVTPGGGDIASAMMAPAMPVIPMAPTPIKSEIEPSMPPMATPVYGTPIPRSPEAERARREALARKLGVGRGSLAPEGRRSTPPPGAGNSEAAAQELKRRHDAALGGGRRAQVERYVEAARAALKTNPAAAANAYRLALTLDPNDPYIAAAHKEAAGIAAAALADGYLKQAEYESRTGHLAEAARSYSRAAAGMPTDASVLLRAADALLKSSGDLRQAADFAKRAAALTPKRVEPRITLIEILQAAAMPLAAKRELDLAREIAPHDDRIVELSKRLK
jgi:curved DNA-binding protein CbpA